MTKYPLPCRIDECIADLRELGFIVNIWAPPIGARNQCQVRVTRGMKDKKFKSGLLSFALRRAVIWARKETEE